MKFTDHQPYYRKFLFFLLGLFLSATGRAQVLQENTAVIVLKKRVLHIGFEQGRQPKITAENLLIIKHGKQRVDLSPLERIGYSKFNRLLTVRVFTVMPNGDTLHVTRFTDQSVVQAGVFYDDYMERTFMFPGAIPGAVSCLHYTEELTEPHFLGAYYFNSFLPVLQSEFEIRCHRRVHLEFSAFNASTVQFRHNKFGKERHYAWSASNVPVFHKTAGEQDLSYRAPHVIPRIAYYRLPRGTKVPILADVSDLYKWYSALLDSTEEKSKDAFLRGMAENLTAGLTTAESKAKAIFHWVQQNIQYIAFEDGYGGLIPRKAAEVLRRRYGDCKDMTALLVALMRRAGIDARFAWIGTRRLPYSYAQLPTPMTDNHMIAAVRTSDGWLFLDATDPELPFGLPSAMIQGKEALIGKDRNEYEIQIVPVADASLNMLTDSAFVEFSPDTLRVSGCISGSGYIKGELNGKNPLVTDRNIAFNRWEISRSEDSMKTVCYEYRQHHAAVVQNGKVYFNPHAVFVKYREKWLPPTTWSQHWESEYAFVLRQKQFIRLPSGLQIEQLPADAKARYPYFGFEIVYEKQRDGINIIHTVFLNKLFLTENLAAEWSAFAQEHSYHLRQNIILYPVH